MINEMCKELDLDKCDVRIVRGECVRVTGFLVNHSGMCSSVTNNLALILTNASPDTGDEAAQISDVLAKRLQRTRESSLGLIAVTTTYQGGPSVEDINLVNVLLQSVLDDGQRDPKISIHGIFNEEIFILAGVEVCGLLIDLIP